jgi:stearoyl-CoA desaturase (delta-9 desaturase)
MAVVAYAPAEPATHEAAPTVSPLGRLLTLVIVGGPPLALLAMLPSVWRHGIAWRDVVLAAFFYVISAVGVTVGYHRLFTHHSFRANRPLKVLLAIAGSMAVQGSVCSWVALHRRHHRFADQPGDPHSARPIGAGPYAFVRALLHSTFEERYAADLLRDRDLRIVSSLFPLFAIGSFALAFGMGWALSGTLGGALSALLWAGIVRMMLLHHVTWSVNSICHAIGSRPATRDNLSTNCASLAVLSLGESWHNFHHAHPSCARHGVRPHQLDSSAALIRVFERVGWATHVRWPTASQIADCDSAP